MTDEGLRPDRPQIAIEMLRVYTRDAELFAGNAAAGLL
jgi:hypothetical protein